MSSKNEQISIRQEEWIITTVRLECNVYHGIKKWLDGYKISLPYSEDPSA